MGYSIVLEDSVWTTGRHVSLLDRIPLTWGKICKDGVPSEVLFVTRENVSRELIGSRSWICTFFRLIWKYKKFSIQLWFPHYFQLCVVSLTITLTSWFEYSNSFLGRLFIKQAKQQAMTLLLQNRVSVTFTVMLWSWKGTVVAPKTKGS